VVVGLNYKIGGLNSFKSLLKNWNNTSHTYHRRTKSMIMSVYSVCRSQILWWLLCIQKLNGYLNDLLCWIILVLASKLLIFHVFCPYSFSFFLSFQIFYLEVFNRIVYHVHFACLTVFSSIYSYVMLLNAMPLIHRNEKLIGLSPLFNIYLQVIRLLQSCSGELTCFGNTIKSN
jgi:hypothetical protein